MLDRFKEFIGIDDNYDDYDDEQAYYDDDDFVDETRTTRENYTSLIDEPDLDYEDSLHDDVTYESTTYSSTSTSTDNTYSSTTGSDYSTSSSYSPETYQTSRYQKSSKRGDNVVSMTENNFRSNSSMRISIQEPLDYEQDAPNVINDILDKKVVVLNLEMVDSDMRRRIFDFVSGAVYALEGTVEKVTKGIFVITPKGVHIDSNITEQITDGNYNQL